MALLHEINNGTERFSVAHDGSVQVNSAYTLPTVVTTTANYVLTAQTDGSTAWAADGGGTVKGTGTATRVAFWSASDTISSNADLYWDNTNKRLGIGTSSPDALLELSKSVANAQGFSNSSFNCSRWKCFYYTSCHF